MTTQELALVNKDITLRLHLPSERAETLPSGIDVHAYYSGVVWHVLDFCVHPDSDLKLDAPLAVPLNEAPRTLEDDLAGTQDITHVTLRGEVVGDYTIRFWPDAMGEEMWQALMDVKAWDYTYHLDRLHPNRQELEEQCRAIHAAGGVLAKGPLMPHPKESRLDVLVDQWAPWTPPN